MKREILYRGINFQREWVYGDFFHSYANDDIAIAYYREGSKTPTFDAIFPESVGQYTGLKDKEGNKIFEGDIVHLKGNGYDGSKVGKDYYRVVTFHEGSFCLSIEDGVHHPVHTPIYEYCDSHSVVNWVVIGNVIDKPELIK